MAFLHKRFCSVRFPAGMRTIRVHIHMKRVMCMKNMQFLAAIGAVETLEEAGLLTAEEVERSVRILNGRSEGRRGADDQSGGLLPGFDRKGGAVAVPRKPEELF